MLLEVHVSTRQIFFLQMRPYFPTEVEGKDVSSKLMVMVGVYVCYILICRIQVIKQTYVT